MYAERKELYRRLEAERNSKVICYVTGDRPGQEAQINADVFDLFVNHLDEIGDVQKISLFLYTRGGDTLTAWSLINLLRQFCKELEVIIPSKCHSAGTIMTLGANKIIMTKQATLGPIDPSVNTPLNPKVIFNGQEVQLPVSVEEIKGYIALAKDEFEIDGSDALGQILLSLGEKVHPLVLGMVYRAQSQIQMLATKLLAHQVTDAQSVEKIVNFLCSDSGSHDYTINRIEAERDLGLSLEKPTPELYGLIKEIYEDFKKEMHLGEQFSADAILGTNNYAAFVSVRSILEAADTFSYQFQTKGNFQRPQVPAGHPQPSQFGIIFNLTSERWERYDQ